MHVWKPPALEKSVLLDQYHLIGTREVHCASFLATVTRLVNMQKNNISRNEADRCDLQPPTIGYYFNPLERSCAERET